MKRYNMPHRSRVVKTRLTDEEYADFTARLAPYGMSQSEFIRQAITRATMQKRSTVYGSSGSAFTTTAWVPSRFQVPFLCRHPMCR